MEKTRPGGKRKPSLSKLEHVVSLAESENGSNKLPYRRPPLFNAEVGHRQQSTNDDVKLDHKKSPLNLQTKTSRDFETASDTSSGSAATDETMGSANMGFQSFISNINYISDHLNYLHIPTDQPSSDESSRFIEEHLRAVPTFIEGYTLKLQFHKAIYTDLFYFGIDNSTGENVVLRISAPLTTPTAVVGFFNEWYILSGLNPSSKHRVWTNETCSNPFLESGSHLKYDPERPDVLKPVSLPLGIPGILYPKIVPVPPISPIGVEGCERMALVFENSSYFTLDHFYIGQRVNILQIPEIYRVPPLDDFNETKVAATTAKLNTSGARSFFDEMELKVRQYPRSIISVISIIGDIILVLKSLKIVHELGIVHNGITTTNILKSKSWTSLPVGKQVVLTAWDFCFSIQPEDCSFGYRKRHLKKVPELLPYLSPESTGEANMSVDYRSDFYSIGIVLYELIVGCVPLQSDHPINLIRMHILQKPIAPQLIAPAWITETLSDIIMKLLEKKPSDRYLDCTSIINDLIAVKNTYIDHVAKYENAYSYWNSRPDYREILKKESEIKSTHIGSPSSFLLPKSLYGRKQEYSQIFELYESFSKGINMIVMSGESGVGKTTIMNDMKLSPLSKSEFYFTWKFDKFDSNISVYSCLLRGIRSIFGQILSGSPENISKWRNLIMSKITVDLSLLFYRIPELKQLLGSKYTNIYESQTSNHDRHHQNQYQRNQQYEQSEENQERQQQQSQDPESGDSNLPLIGMGEQTLNLEMQFRYIIKVLYGLFGFDGLTIFLEDIQWCSQSEWAMISESLEFFHANDIQDDVSVKIIGSFGTSKYDSENDMTKDILTDYLDGAHISFHWIELDTISQEAFKEYFRDTFMIRSLNSSYSSGSYMDVSSTVSPYSKRPLRSNTIGRVFDSKIDTIADILFEATDGSILHTMYFIRTAYMKGLIRFMDIGLKREKKWDLTFHSDMVQSNSKIVQNYLDVALTADAKSLMKLAAISSKGFHFYLSDLMIVSNLPLERVVSLLNLCLESQLIVPGNVTYKFPFHAMTSGDFDCNISDSSLWEIACQTRYRFCHDSIVNALHEEMELKNELTAYHKLCGMRSYKRNTKENNLSISQYLKMAYHFTKSWQVANSEESRAFFEVLIKAGKYASSTYKMETSLMYFEVANNLVDKNDLKKKLKITLTLCQIHFYLKNYDQCLQIIAKAEVLEKPTTFLMWKVRCYFKLGKFDEGLEASIQGLQKLDVIEVYTEDSKCEELAKRVDAKVPLSVLEIRNLNNQKQTTNSKVKLIYELVGDMIMPTYATGRDTLRRALVSQCVLLMHEYGVSSYCSITLLEYANTFVRMSDESSFLKAIEFSKIALNLVDSDTKLSFTNVQAVYEIYITSLAALMEPISDVLRYFDVLLSTPKPFTSTTSTSFSVVKIASKLHLLYLTGHTANEIIELGSNNRLHRPNQMADVNDVQLDGFRLLNLEITLEEFEDKFSLEGSTRDFQYCYHVCKLFWFTAHGNFEAAGDIIANKVGNMLDYMPFMLVHIAYYFCSYIALCTKPASVPESFRVAMATKIESYFTIWSRHCPSTFRAKLLMIQAMKLSTENPGSVLEILDLYEEAVQWAKKYDMWYDMGWANTLCAMWLVRVSENKKRAITFFQNAIGCLKKVDAKLYILKLETVLSKFSSAYHWAGVVDFSSARNNVSSLKKPLSNMSNVFVPLKSEQQSQKRREHFSPSSTSASLDTTKSKEATSLKPPANIGGASELNRAVNACLSISESSVESDIVFKLLESTILFSTADYGVVTIVREEEPHILAIGSPTSIFPLANEPLSSRTDLCPVTLIKQVLHSGEITIKTKEDIQLEIGREKDEYYSNNSSLSVICIPMMNEDGVFGVLYLEKQVSMSDEQNSPTFLRGTRRDLLDLLCSQAAVSLEKSRLYAQMEYAKKAAEDATAEKASFLANMSHEIRTPFNSLLSCSIFLLDTELTLSQKEYVETIKSSAMVTLNIIDGILAFSKIEHGSFTLESAPFSLNECIESALQIVGEQAATNDLELVFFNKCPFIEKVIGDVTRFRQIIINLVGNSVKFTPQGYILVETTAVEITKGRYEIIVTVKDTGIGIPKESHNKVFGAFSQVDGSSRRVYGGSGLGLAISKKLTDIMGGSLTFESEEGVGSTFQLNVSAQVVVSQTPEITITNEDAKLVGCKNSVLVIDNNRLGSLALKESLMYYGLDVTIVQNSDILKETHSFDDALMIFIHSDQFYAFKNATDLSKLRSKLVLVAQFGATLPSELNSNFISSMLLSPFQRHKIVKLLIEVKQKLKSNSGKTKTNFNGSSDTSSNDKKDSIPSKTLAEQYPLRILLAEDNIINIKVALQHLKKLGYKADHAKDGVEVIEMCNSMCDKKLKYDVILLDIQMPKKDGFAAAIELREQFQNEGKEEYLPALVALTANVAGENRQKSIKCGMIDFISKPILPSELRRVLTRIGSGEV
ncbi:histidine protein kinase 1 [[Candida] anglica]|uniref:Histidine protein kinase 1 n=1 Tax=[Candida] anglica TaxID=148631 RepID=A0ABP0E9X2_9ASCO